MKRLFAALLALLLLISFAGCKKSQPAATDAVKATKTKADKTADDSVSETDSKEKQLKVAMLLPGTINDGGWNAMAYAALKAAEEKFSAQIAYTENVGQNDQRRVARQYADQEYTVIIGHGFEFGDALTEVADEYPDTYFLGLRVKNGKNLGSMEYAYGETGALAGVLIGMSPDIQKVGVVMALENPTGMQEMINSEITAKKYNPDIEFVYSYTGDWNDIAKAKEAAITLLNQGADLILSELSGPFEAMVQAVQEHNKKFYVVSFDGYDLDPERILGSSVHDATKATLAAIQLILDGEFEGDIYGFGLADNVMSMGRYGPSVTPEMEAEVEKIKKEIIDGTYELEILLDD
jgi:basic membrane protein A